jgi:hypothetical protein
MNQLLDNRYAENFQRLALGLEPVDAMRLRRVGTPLTIKVEQPPKASAKPPVQRHASCLHALLYYPALLDSVDIRIFEDYEPFEPPLLVSQQLSPRRFVPRRFRIPLRTAATVDTFPYTDRVRRPFVFPGAAYDLDSCATGLRGRVLRGGKPMRWARVVAALPSSGQVVGRAHGDDRGEFLLLIGSSAIPVGDLASPITLSVTVFGPVTIPSPATPDLPSLDPLWDLPIEAPQAPGAPDTVSTGETLPAGYTASAAGNIDFFLGELRSGLAAFTIV